MKSVHEFTYTLSSVDIASTGKAKPSAIANALQEAARDHAHHLGWGVETLHEKKKYWVLSRSHVNWTQQPHHNVTLKVVTWPKGVAGMFALRDFEIWEEDTKIGVCTTSWALIDVNTGRPGTFTDLPELFSERKDIHAIETPAEKVDSRTPGAAARTIQPLYTDLDEIGHVNNAKYLDWAWSVISADERTHTTGWTINYLREVREEDDVTIEVARDNHSVICRGVLSSGKLAFAVSFHQK